MTANPPKYRERDPRHPFAGYENCQIAFRMEDVGISATELAAIVGVSASVAASWVRDPSTIPSARIGAICDALGASAMFLRGEAFDPDEDEGHGGESWMVEIWRELTSDNKQIVFKVAEALRDRQRAAADEARVVDQLY